MSKNILIVEDDLNLQRIYSEKLGNKGFIVFLALDSQQALTILKNTKISLILLDIMLPGKMNGLEFLKHIKSLNYIKNIPILVFTNLDTEKEEAKKLGAIDCLIKSNTDLEEIVEKVNKYSL